PTRTLQVDKKLPTSRATALAFTNATSIEVGYGADGTGSPLKRVELWVRKPGESTYAEAAMDRSPAAAGHHFTYTATAGDGAYAFYTRAFDAAGNVEAAPASPDSTTVVDMALPTSTASAPSLTNSASIQIDYTADGTGSPL